MLISKDNFKAIEKKIKDKLPEEVKNILFKLLKNKALSLAPMDSLKLLFDFENMLYVLEGQESIRYGNGIHTKHKHIKYHDFFIENIPPYSRVLDIGCGQGALDYDIARSVKEVFIYGIDVNLDLITTARSRHNLDNIKYICGDATNALPNEEFDVIILSNVLEHIEYRIEFLNKLYKLYKPKKFLIRVPIFERDWRVPLKKELGIDYRLDQTHFIEYLQEEFFDEIARSGLVINHYTIKWGECWADISGF